MPDKDHVRAVRDIGCYRHEYHHRHGAVRSRSGGRLKSGGCLKDRSSRARVLIVPLGRLTKELNEDS